MTSNLAKTDIEQLWADGLKPTVEDIIRLNALALRIERAKAKNPTSCLYALPRAAFICEPVTNPEPRTIAFRQPTIGHELWFDKVARVSGKDYQTVLALHAYALSRDADKLCDPYDRNAVKREVEAFLCELAFATEDQVFAALNYVQNGLTPTDGEYPPPLPDADEPREDWEECVALGVMLEAQAVICGLTVAEAKRIPRRQLLEMIRTACSLRTGGASRDANIEMGDYYRTLDEIKERLAGGNQTIKQSNNQTISHG